MRWLAIPDNRDIHPPRKSEGCGDSVPSHDIFTDGTGADSGGGIRLHSLEETPRQSLYLRGIHSPPLRQRGGGGEIKYFEISHQTTTGRGGHDVCMLFTGWKDLAV